MKRYSSAYSRQYDCMQILKNETIRSRNVTLFPASPFTDRPGITVGQLRAFSGAITRDPAQSGRWQVECPCCLVLPISNHLKVRMSGRQCLPPIRGRRAPISSKKSPTSTWGANSSKIAANSVNTGYPLAYLRPSFGPFIAHRNSVPTFSTESAKCGHRAGTSTADIGQTAESARLPAD